MPGRRSLGLVFAAALAGTAHAQGTNTFDGQYTGVLTLTKTVGGDCSEPALGAVYPLTIAGGTVRFSYTPRFATTLTGRIATNGTFTASARLRKGTVEMTGRIQGGRVTAAIVSPSCNYAFQTRQGG